MKENFPFEITPPKNLEEFLSKEFEDGVYFSIGDLDEVIPEIARRAGMGTSPGELLALKPALAEAVALAIQYGAGEEGPKHEDEELLAAIHNWEPKQ